MTKYGFCEVDITPQLGCFIPGYFERREVEDIMTPLYAKAIVADDGKKVTAICVIDAICVTDELCAKAVKGVLARIPIDPAGVLIQATHIHTGGPVRPDTDADFERGERYRAWVADKICDSIVIAYNRRTEMTAVYNKEKVYGISFVRNYVMKDGSIRTNPPFHSPEIVKRVTEADPDMPYLFFTDKDGKARGILVNFACHHDCVHGNATSSDYSGILAKELRKKFGEDFICVFMNGFCGNINNWDCIEAYDMPSVENHIEMGETLAKAVIDSLPDAKKMSDERVDFEKELMHIKRREINPEIIERAKAYLNKDQIKVDISDAQGESYLIATAPAIIKMYGEDAPREFALYSQAIRLGDCVIYAVPGEMYSQYGEFLKKNAPTDKVFLAELSNARAPYIPIPELYNSENVYEAAPTACTLHEGGGMELCEKALELSKKIFQ